MTAATHAFTTLDYLMLAAYLAVTVWVGWKMSGKARSTRDFFLAGRSVGWLAVTLSSVATAISAISFMGMPAFVFRYDLTLMIASVSTPLIIPVAIPLFLRLYYRLQLYTAYECLEHRFNLATRTLTSLIFLFYRGAQLGVVLYAPCLALEVITGLPLVWMILAMGAATTLYAVKGGMKAVIWTDIVQMLFMAGGLATVIAVAMGQTGSAGEIWRIASERGHTRMFDWSLDPTVPFAFWALLIGHLVQVLSWYGTDQITLQRFLTARSAREAEISLARTILLAMGMACAFYYVGLCLTAFYAKNPEKLAAGLNPEHVLPYFVVHELPAGVSGLLIAAIFAAAMSTLSGGINSLSTVCTVDFYQRFRRAELSEAHRLLASRVFSLFWGVFATVAALFARQLGGIILASPKISSFFGGVLLGVFLLGILTRRVTSPAAMLGALAGLAAVILAATFTNVSFFLYAPIGCVVTFLCGTALSSDWARTRSG